ncbi:hypothetical protein YC2023_040070 [Brassica napus]
MKSNRWITKSYYHAGDSLLDIDLGWSDEEEDEAFDNLVRLVGEGYVFHNEMFKGGLNSADLVRMRNEREQKKKKSQRK